MKNKIISLILAIIFYIIDHNIILHNTHKIENEKYDCKCAKTWHVPYISKMVIFIVISEIILLLITPYILSQFDFYNSIEFVILIFAIIAFFVQLYYTYVLIRYTIDLYKNDCNCIDPRFKKVLIIYSIFRVGFILLTAILTYFIGKTVGNNLKIIPTHEIIKLSKKLQ